MKDRCSNPDNVNYTNYGGRGIKVCARWEDFTQFLEDVGTRPTPQHSIERNNNDEDYTPSNCRWATIKEQAVNKRSNVWVLINGTPYAQIQALSLLGVTWGSIKKRMISKKETRQEAFNYFTRKRGL